MKRIDELVFFKKMFYYCLKDFFEIFVIFFVSYDECLFSDDCYNSYLIGSN